MPTNTINLTITCGPDTQGEGGSCWNADSPDADGYSMHFAHGGTSRGPRNDQTPDGWLTWLKSQVRSECGAWRFKWADAEVSPRGWSQGAGHAPNGIRVRVTATRA